MKNNIILIVGGVTLGVTVGFVSLVTKQFGYINRELRNINNNLDDVSGNVKVLKGEILEEYED